MDREKMDRDTVEEFIFYSVYLYFMIKDPDILQSEEFIRKMELIKNNKEEYNDRE